MNLIMLQVFKLNFLKPVNAKSILINIVAFFCSGYKPPPPMYKAKA